MRTALTAILAISLLLVACSSSTTPAATTPTQDTGNTVPTPPPAPIIADTGSSATTPTPTTPTPTATTPTPSTPPATTTPSGITATELAAHKTTQDCWVAYKGTVYDVTAFLPRHPGGVSAIGRYCGTSSSFASAFNRQHGTRYDTRIGSVSDTIGAYSG